MTVITKRNLKDLITNNRKTDLYMNAYTKPFKKDFISYFQR